VKYRIQGATELYAELDLMFRCSQNSTIARLAATDKGPRRPHPLYQKDIKAHLRRSSSAQTREEAIYYSPDERHRRPGYLAVVDASYEPNLSARVGNTIQHTCFGPFQPFFSTTVA
jgi:hypothetical protein